MGKKLSEEYRRERAIKKIAERSIQVGECREWQGRRNAGGYGKMRLFDEQLAHRVAWVARHGAIPSDMYVMHKCDNPSCVRIEHLQLGTPADNNHDRERKGRGKRLSGEAWYRARGRKAA